MKKSETPGHHASSSSSSLAALFHRPVAEPHTVGPTTHTQPRPAFSCMCKKSNCLKLYCECFANGVYCNTSSAAAADVDLAYRCHCQGCCNNVQQEKTRREAIEATLDRNPHAFRPKIISLEGGGEHLVKAESLLLKEEEGGGEGGEGGGGGGGATKHLKGCHCKKSHCLKKYCEV